MHQWIAVICLQFMIMISPREKLCQLWLDNNYLKFLPIYKRFNKDQLINNINVKMFKDYTFLVVSKYHHHPL